MRNTVDIHSLQVGNFYKFVDETTSRRIEFIGYVCRADNDPFDGRLHYDVAILQSNDNKRFINSDTAMAYIEAGVFRGTIYQLDNPTLTYDILEPTTNTIALGRRI